MASAVIGDRLVVTQGSRRGSIGEVQEIIKLPYGLVNYKMKFDDGTDDNCLYLEIPAEHTIQSYNPQADPERGFNITDYLGQHEMYSIAKKIYEDKAIKFIEDVFNNRVEWCGNPANQVLTECANTYAPVFFDKYKEDALRIFKKTIEMETPLVGDEECMNFGRSIHWALERTAEKYIDEHQDEIKALMADRIKEIAKSMSADAFTTSMKKKVEDLVKSTMDQLFGGKQ